MQRQDVPKKVKILDGESDSEPVEIGPFRSAMLRSVASLGACDLQILVAVGPESVGGQTVPAGTQEPHDYYPVQDENGDSVRVKNVVGDVWREIPAAGLIGKSLKLRAVEPDSDTPQLQGADTEIWVVLKS